MNAEHESISLANGGAPSMPEQLVAIKHQACSSTLKRLDLSTFATDPNSAVNRHSSFVLGEREMLATFVVVDLKHAYVTPAAERAMLAECVTPAWAIAQYAASYCSRIAARAVKGKNARVLVMNAEACRFQLGDEKCGVAIIVSGSTETSPNGPVRVTRIQLASEVDEPLVAASVGAAN